MESAAQNTDTTLHVFKDGEGDFAPQGTVFLTQGGGIGFCVGGLCIVKPPQDWHAMAANELSKPSTPPMLSMPAQEVMQMPIEPLDLGSARIERSMWTATGELRWRRPRGALDEEKVLEQLWERHTGERTWREVGTCFED